MLIPNLYSKPKHDSGPCEEADLDWPLQNTSNLYQRH